MYRVKETHPSLEPNTRENNQSPPDSKPPRGMMVQRGKGGVKRTCADWGIGNLADEAIKRTDKNEQDYLDSDQKTEKIKVNKGKPVRGSLPNV